MIDTQGLENAELWECLNRWLRVIQSMIRHGRAPIGTTNENYIRLHRDLLTGLNVPGENALTRTDELRQTLYRSVRPWVHLESLARCDKRILRMLEREVRTARDHIMPGHHLRSQLRQRVAAALVVLVIAVIIIGIVSSGERRALAASRIGEVWDYIEGIRAQVWLGFTQSSMNQRLIVLAGSIVLVGTFFLRDTKRS